MDNELLAELKKMSKLLALNLVKDLKPEDKFRELYLTGYQPKEIAEICNTTRNTVSVTLSRMKIKSTKNK